MNQADKYYNFYHNKLKITPNQVGKKNNCHQQSCQNLIWQSKFAGCPSSSTHNSKNTSLQCVINYPGERLNVANLNPIMYERGRILASEPNFYNNFRTRRQQFIQLLTIDWPIKNSGYLKEIKKPEDSFCFNKRIYGNPKNIDF
jgi:hypothetical protein